MPLKIIYLGNLADISEALRGMEGIDLAAWLIEEGDDPGLELLKLAHKNQILFFQVRSAKDVQEVFQKIGEFDLGVIANFGIILSERNLSAAKKGFINAHLGLLPEQSGRNPVNQAIIKGEMTAGVTLHKVTKKVDDGPIIFKRTVSVGYRRDPAQVLEHLRGMVPSMLKDYLSSLK